MSEELRDNKTGEVITPESITARLKSGGVDVDNVEVEIQSEVAEHEDSLEVSFDDDTKPESSFDDLAKAYGWNPSKKKSSKEFIEYALENLEPRGKAIQELKETVDDIKSHMAKQREAGYRQALEDLKKQRLAAIEYGDANAVDYIDQQIQQQQKEMIEASPPSKEATDFVARNASWIQDTSPEAEEMKALAVQLDQTLTARNLPPAEHIAKVEAALKAAYPHRFPDESLVEEETRAPVVESPQGTSGAFKKRTKVKFADLSNEQKDCARRFERSGVMSREEYIRQLAELGEI